MLRLNQMDHPMSLNLEQLNPILLNKKIVIDKQSRNFVDLLPVVYSPDASQSVPTWDNDSGVGGVDG